MAILAIDRGRKRMGLAYVKDDHGIAFPLGSLDNDDQVMYHISHMVTQHKVHTILVGYPSKEIAVKKYIDSFIKELGFVVPSECGIVKVNEDYSSIQANAREGIYKKTAAEDSLAAIFLLEEYLKKTSLG